MSDTTPPETLEVDDEWQLGQADWIIGGEEARAARRQGTYAAYVLALLSLVYGFPVLRAVFATSDTAWLRSQLFSPLGYAVLAGAVVGVLGTALWAGRFRGPVVPPLPWIDLVLPVPVDRALAVRRWWRYSVVGSLVVGTIGGMVVGGGLAFSRTTGPVSIAVCVVGGVLLAWLTARVWLWGQVRSWPGPDRGPSLLWRTHDALRELHSESLRIHAANTSTLAGSALTGNLRTARLTFARPITRARRARLSPGRAFSVMVRRDLLGLRRQPATALVGLGLTTLGTVPFVWGLVSPAAPPAFVALAMIPLYLGFGTLAEGLRMQTDNVGTPTLLGIGPIREGLAHLVTPVVGAGLVLGIGGVVGVVVAPDRADLTRVVAGTVLVLVLLAGAHLAAAFRGDPPVGARPPTMISWYATPATTSVLLGALTVFALRSGPPVLVGVVVAVIGGVLAYGLHRLRSLTLEHRR